MFDILPKALKDFIDSIFTPPAEILRIVLDYLDRAIVITGQGINLNNYFSFFNFLPVSLQMVVRTIISAIVFIAILKIIKSVMRLYFASKEGIKWW